MSRATAPSHAACCLAFVALAALPATAEEVRFRDLEGREVVLPAGPAERLAIIPIPPASTVIAIDGSAERLAGMHPQAKLAIEEGILGRIFPDALVVPSDITIGNSGWDFMPNIETLAALSPDLVVQWGGRDADIIDPLTNAGLTTALMLYGNEQHAKDVVTMLGAITGNEEKAARLVAWRDDVAERIAATAATIPEAERLTVLNVSGATDEYRIAGSDTYTDFMATMVGGIDVAAELPGFKPVNAEQIAAWDPDVILISTFAENVEPSYFYEHPVLSSVTAARERRVYRYPLGGYRWDPPNQESPLTWMWLAELLYPEAFDFDLRAEMRESYVELYGHTLTEAEIDEILGFGMNGTSLYYELFAAR